MSDEPTAYNGGRKILIVDDIEINRVMLSMNFNDCYEVLEAENGLEALDIIDKEKDNLAVVLLDLVMPVMDGFEVLQTMNKNGLIKTIPVIIITGEKDDDKTLMGYQLGVADLVTKPFNNSDIVVRRVNNVIELYAHKHELEQKLREQKQTLEEQSNRLRQANQFIIDVMSTTVELRSFESGEHIKRIRILTKTLLESYSSYYPMTEEMIETISSASAVHDIGKVAIPDSILLKPGPLTKEEFETMKSHTVKGCEFLQSLNYTQDQAYFTYCYEICRHHHERWDGRGYPDGLRGDEISIWAQAVSLADVYDALTSKRVYKGAYTHNEAVAMILRGECGVFNPSLIECFLQVQEALFEEIHGMNGARH